MTDMTVTTRTTIGPPAERTAPDRTTGGRAWRALGACFAIVALLWGTFQVITMLAHEEFTETESYRPEGVAVLDVHNSAGSVTIVGRDDAETIEVTADISDGLRPTGNAQEVVGDRLEIRGSCPLIGSDWCSIGYTITVPSDISVTASADDGRLVVSDLTNGAQLDNDNARVEARNIEGPLSISNDNGRVTATGIDSASVDVTNDNGDVTLSLLTPPQRLDANSDNGDVEVIFPETQDAYRLNITTDNGDIVNAIRTDPDSQRTVTIETDNGNVTARYGP